MLVYVSFYRIMQAKNRFRVGILFYVSLLFLTPGEYSLFSICVDSLASLVSVVITAFFIAYLQTRKHLFSIFTVQFL